jgi:hypothetical protein
MEFVIWNTPRRNKRWYTLHISFSSLHGGGAARRHPCGFVVGVLAPISRTLHGGRATSLQEAVHTTGREDRVFPLHCLEVGVGADRTHERKCGLWQWDAPVHPHPRPAPATRERGAPSRVLGRHRAVAAGRPHMFCLPLNREVGVGAVREPPLPGFPRATA